MLAIIHKIHNIHVYRPWESKDYKKNGLFRGPERALPLLQPVNIESNWTSNAESNHVKLCFCRKHCGEVMFGASGAVPCSGAQVSLSTKTAEASARTSKPVRGGPVSEVGLPVLPFSREEPTEVTRQRSKTIYSNSG